MTLDFYNQNAQQFFNDTIQVDMSELYQPFITQVKPNGCILDAGCGSGRDAKAFMELGFRVEAMDASIEMVKLASSYTGLNVKHQTLESVTDIEVYDGIWACASLLHLSEKQLPLVIRQFEAALRPDGVWYMSFKYGDGEREKAGRVFTDMNEARFAALMAQRPNLTVLKQWITEDKRPDRDEQWLNVVVGKSVVKA
ncbi:class I SAM-dependent methyltransferase [Nitrincola iocasae]|uniref:Class I SAM-dependent methyltransferase n=1 Tax=Nitrincola iocasae TaxID=2614693 RepID=A0A5J6LBE7_9GAMM|nr:class I SAM-dependent methyltransferase [Nitrincola iocasae]QEW05895.1 class I SAM-dependent methyltransferase [Nitrincola iocasae]